MVEEGWNGRERDGRRPRRTREDSRIRRGLFVERGFDFNRFCRYLGEITETTWAGSACSATRPASKDDQTL